jgi:hypothetical protein
MMHFEKIGDMNGAKAAAVILKASSKLIRLKNKAYGWKCT